MIGWLHDDIGVSGGAELSVGALADARPEWAGEIVFCPPNKRPPAEVEAFVVSNCVTYGAQWVEALEAKPVVKRMHDLWVYGSPVLRRWILDNATLLVFNSPRQMELFQFTYSAPAIDVPQPVDVARFRRAAEGADGREGNVWLGRVSTAKGVQNVVDWALRNDDPVDIYGPWYGEPYVMEQIVPPARYCGQVDYEDVPALLARYRWFVYRPTNRDCCDRAVVEAWASGLGLILSPDAGYFYDWVESVDFQNAAADFWEAVGDAVAAA